MRKASQATKVGRGRQPALEIARLALWIGIWFFFVSCANQVLINNKSQDLLKQDEYDKVVRIQELPNQAASTLLPSGLYITLPGLEPHPQMWWPRQYRKGKTMTPPPQAAAVAFDEKNGLLAQGLAPKLTAQKHEPESEDSEGFTGRRPDVDPFRVGEKVTLDVSYFGVSAGDVTIEVQPFVQVNGQRSYKFVGHAISTSVFAVFYAVNDWFETFVDFDTLTPSTYELHVKETKQLRETRAVFDWEQKLATWWDKKINSEQKIEEYKKQWEIPSYSQNVFSIFYYLRSFQLKPGKTLSFRLAHENENLTVTAQVLRKEHISTDAGEFDTVVVKPKIELNGVFKPVGDIFIWLTDDEQKMIVRIESKIKIGTIVGVAKKIDRGE